jgi:hypothetical protein
MGMSVDRRRSDRVMLTIPLLVLGTDPRGKPFRESARTVSLNRHGARIRIGRHLRSSDVVRLTIPRMGVEAEFRVVGPVSPFSAEGGEYAVESLDRDRNIWGIHFPAPGQGETTDPRGLLECRQCNALALLRLSTVEVEVLESSGIIYKFCQRCGRPTPWAYTREQMTPLDGSDDAAALERVMAAAAVKRVEERRHRRIFLQVAAMVRDYYGGVEITRSENVSKDGLCFTSEKNYLVGQAVLVACPYLLTDQHIEVRARIVRRQDMEGTNRKVYGVCYDQQAN